MTQEGRIKREMTERAVQSDAQRLRSGPERPTSVYDAAWAVVLSEPQLTLARARLSIHELRTLIATVVSATEIPARHLANINAALWTDAEKECDALKADLRKAVEREQERCAKIADAEAAEAYRNPQAANYRNTEQEKMARYTASRIAALIRADRPAPMSGED